MLESLNSISGILAFAVAVLVERKRIHAAILEIIQDWSKPKYVSVVQSPSQNTAQDTAPRKVKKTRVKIFSKLAFFFKSLIAIIGSTLLFLVIVTSIMSSLWLDYILSEDVQLWLEIITMLVGIVFGAKFLRKQSWLAVISILAAFFLWNYIILFNIGIFRAIVAAILTAIFGH
jgi:hypothetical protein